MDCSPSASRLDPKLQQPRIEIDASIADVPANFHEGRAFVFPARMPQVRLGEAGVARGRVLIEALHTECVVVSLGSLEGVGNRGV